MRPLRPLSLLLVMASNWAWAQNTPPDDRNLDIELYEPALGSHAYLGVAGAEVMAKKQFQLALSISYMAHPFRVYTVDPANGNALMTRSDVVSSLLGGHLMAAYGLNGKMHVGISLPVVMSMQGDGLDPGSGMPQDGGLSVAGIGDARLELAYRFFQQGTVTVAVIPAITLPTAMSLGSKDSDFLGESFPSFRPRVAMEWSSRDGKFSAAGNLGVILRKDRTLYSSTVGQQLTYGVAGAFHINSRMDVLAQVFGRNGFGDSLSSAPLEGDAAFQIRATPAVSVLAGAGLGLVQGVGAPQFRLFAALSFAPDYGDSDGDGIPNMSDRCPLAPEDKDGFQDADGCPDPDNDGDGIPDDQDKCPNAAEDFDGFQDEDGCPDLDNDGDGIPDTKDACPNEPEDHKPPLPNDGCPAGKFDSDGDGVMDDVDKCPNDPEDKDGFQDADGCPDPDNDHDGILDAQDQCPNDPEDKDGFQDADGCPDPDNDGDGVPDAQDKCPNQPETINGYQDEDGCPDSGGRALVTMNGNILTLADAIKWTGPAPARGSNGLLDQVALTMRVHREVTKWRIVVAAEKQASADKQRALSQGRADALKAYLVQKGIAADRIEAIGAVADKPTVAIVAAERSDKPPAIEVEPDPMATPPPADETPTIEIQ